MDPRDEPPLRDPWLIAAWPGMGHVAVLAASYLVEKLEGRLIQTIFKREYFEVNTVQFEDGIVRRGGPPKSTLHAIEAASGAPRDLLVFMGELQPTYKGYDFCHEIIDLALARGVKRIVTFAAMATQIHPSAPPRVFGVASESSLLPLLARHQVGVLKEGQISGLNGVLLAAAAERGVEAICLLGELPFFAVATPNPKASLAVLQAFERISGVAVDLGKIEGQARQVERFLVELLERATSQHQQQQQQGESPEGSSIPESLPEAAEEPEPPPAAVLHRIEELFNAARTDKAQALQLKHELDRHGLFKKYEDRFLDLFKTEEHG